MDTIVLGTGGLNSKYGSVKPITALRQKASWHPTFRTPSLLAKILAVFHTET